MLGLTLLRAAGSEIEATWPCAGESVELLLSDTNRDHHSILDKYRTTKHASKLGRFIVFHFHPPDHPLLSRNYTILVSLNVSSQYISLLVSLISITVQAQKPSTLPTVILPSTTNFHSEKLTESALESRS